MIEYIEQEHLYLYEGVIIPSVTQILEFIFPHKYKDIPIEILQNKAEYGTKLHELIEILDKEQKFVYEPINELKKVYKFNYIIEESLKQYLKLKQEHEIEITSQEQIVCYKGLFAGRYDKEGLVKGETALLDVKTTAELDIEYLSWQLSYYELASGKKYDKLYAIWLPKKQLGRLVEIPRKSEKELLDMLEKYLKERGEKIC